MQLLAWTRLQRMATRMARAKQLQWPRSHAGFSAVILGAKPGSHASGCMILKGYQIATVDVGFVVEKITANLHAPAKATTTNLLLVNLVWGEAEEMGCRTTKLLSKMLPFKAKVLKLQQPRRQKKPFPVPLLRFLPWVLRVTPRELHLVQQWRWKRGELQLPMQEPRI